MTNSGIVTNLTVKCLGNISFEYDDGCDSCVTEETNVYDEDDDSIGSEFYSIDWST